MDDRDQVAYDIVDEALRTYPLDEAPTSLYASVMLQVHKTQKSARFRLSWLDYALSLFAAGMVGTLWILWKSYTPSIPIFLKFQFEIRQAWHQLLLTTAFRVDSLAGWMMLFAALLGLLVILAEFRNPFTGHSLSQR